MFCKCRFAVAFWLGCLFLLVGGLLAGCQTKTSAKPPVAEPVRVALRTEDGRETLPCFVIGHPLSWPAFTEQTRDQERSFYELSLCRGDLLGIGDPEPDMYYVYSGQEAQPLEFLAKGPVVLLNGRPVCLDLKDEGAEAWLEKASSSELACIRNIRLSGSSMRDATALAAFRGSGIVIASDEAYPPEGQDTVLQGILATQPSGLIMPEPQGFETLLDGVPELAHLAWGGVAIPPLGRFKDLTFYWHYGHRPEDVPLADAPKVDLRPLADVPHLRGLVLVLNDYNAVTDLNVLGDLTELQYLVLDKVDHLRDLTPLAPLGALRYLSLGECRNLTDISAITELKGLSHLWLATADQIEDLSPLAELKNLERLVVPSSDLKARREMYDKLQEQLPDTQIVGFCMGSAWILPVLALAAGLAWQRRRKAPASKVVG